MRFRSYSRADLSAMEQLDQVCFSEPFRFDRSLMRQFAEAVNAIVVIAADGAAKESDELAGFIIVHVEAMGPEVTGYVVTIDVAPEYRRGGLGAAMLTQAEDKARAAGAAGMALHVSVDNAGAIRFYESQSYVRAGYVKGFYQAAGLDALVFAKTLSG